MLFISKVTGKSFFGNTGFINFSSVIVNAVNKRTDTKITNEQFQIQDPMKKEQKNETEIKLHSLNVF